MGHDLWVPLARERTFNTLARGSIRRIQHDEARWGPARRCSGEPAQRTPVAEITDLVGLSTWPAGTRMIVRASGKQQEPTFPVSLVLIQVPGVPARILMTAPGSLVEHLRWRATP